MKASISLQEILNAHSIEELKKLGSLNQVRRTVNDGFGFKVAGDGRGWKGYFSRIEKLREIAALVKTESSPTFSANGELFFKSKADKYLFALSELDGQHRMKLLGISQELYFDKNKARFWRNEIATLIHPDNNSHPQAAHAYSKLTELYHSMTEDE